MCLYLFNVKTGRVRIQQRHYTERHNMKANARRNCFLNHGQNIKTVRLAVFACYWYQPHTASETVTQHNQHYAGTTKMHGLFTLSMNQIQLKRVALKHTFSKLVIVTGTVIQTK